MERTRHEVAACDVKVDELQRELEELERRTEAAAGGVAGAMGAKPPEDREYLYLNDRLEKALISLDGVETHGMDDLRALRKGAVKRIQSLLQRGDLAKAAAASVRMR